MAALIHQQNQHVLLANNFSGHKLSEKRHF